jgi:hypothetical protein
MPKLIYRNGPFPGMALELRPGLNKIGRNGANDFQILDISVSSFHAELHVSTMGVAFRDLGSTNGSFVNDVRVTKEMLAPGKRLRLGNVEFDVDTPSANVAIPERPKAVEVYANFLEDGSAACQTHATLAATQKCMKCEKTWCDECVRRTGIVGSPRAMVTCLECGGACAPVVAAVSQKKKGFFDRIGDTMRMIKPK